MPFDQSTISELITAVTWASLSGSNYINPQFRTVFQSQETVSALLSAACLTFCPGLFDVLQAVVPPTAQWFESLSEDVPSNVWGVYVLVLRLKNRQPSTYIGSGTSALRGVRARLASHDSQHLVPQKVSKACKQGYTIVHKALLLSCPIPSAADIPRIRMALVAVEAAVSCLIGAFSDRTKTYGFGSLCPWSQDSFDHNGLCNHNPLLEPVMGDLDLSAEEAEALAAEVAERRRQNAREYQRKLAENPTKQYLEARRSNNAKKFPRTKAIQADRVAKKTFHCKPCKLSFPSNASLQAHNTTPRRQEKAATGGKNYQCEVCNMSFRFKSDLTQHNSTQRHMARMAT